MAFSERKQFEINLTQGSNVQTWTKAYSDGCLAFPRGAMGLSAVCVCDSGIS